MEAAMEPGEHPAGRARAGPRVPGRAHVLPHELAEALSRLADGNLRIENKVPEIARLEKRVDQASERIQTSLLVCGLLVSSSILLFEQAGSGSFQTAFGVAGFLAGLCLVMKAVLRG
jgi:hypothetical protein